MKRKKIITIMIVFFILITSFSAVGAVYFENVKMKIEAPEGFMPIQDNPQWLTKNKLTKDKAEALFKSRGVLLDLINADQTKEFFISKIQSSTTNQIFNLALLQEEERKGLVEQYQKTQQDTGYQIITTSNETISGLSFIHMQVKKEDITSDSYYTVVNGTSFTISMNYYGVEAEDAELAPFISTITFDEIKQKREENAYEFYFSGVAITAALLVVLIAGTRLKDKKLKKKIENEEDKEKSKQLNTKYKKFGGMQILFVITSILSVLMIVMNVVKIAQLMQGQTTTWSKIYIYTDLIQSLVQMILAIMNLVIVFQKRDTTVNKLIKRILLIAVIGALVPFFRMFFIGELYEKEIINPDYFYYEITNLCSAVVYGVIWIGYFKSSLRIKSYYLEKDIEDILLAPKKGYGERIIEKRLLNQTITQFFKKQQAQDKQSAIGKEEIPREYLKSGVFESLRNKGLMRKTKKKYYLKEDTFKNNLYGTLRYTLIYFLPVLIIIVTITVMLSLL